MTTKNRFELEQAFKAECKVIDFKLEYSNFIGPEKYGIVSSLSEKELREKYNLLLCEYEPFVYMTVEQYEPILEFRNNNRKHSRRYAAHVVPFTYEDDISERCNPALIINLFDGKPNWTKLYAAITRLAPKQKARIELHFFDGLTFVEIAKQENVSVQAVQQSVERSLATMKKFLEAENFDPYDDPIWD